MSRDLVALPLGCVNVVGQAELIQTLDLLIFTNFWLISLRRLVSCIYYVIQQGTIMLSDNYYSSRSLNVMAFRQLGDKKAQFC